MQRSVETSLDAADASGDLPLRAVSSARTFGYRELLVSGKFVAFFES